MSAYYLPADTLTGDDPQHSLSAVLDFDHVVMITPHTTTHSSDLSRNPGQTYDTFHIDTAPPGAPRAPESTLDPDGTSTALPYDSDPDQRWELITSGLTGQYGYNGPWLHDSETLSGGVARAVLEHARENGGGYYVSMYAQYTCTQETHPRYADEPEPEDWSAVSHDECETHIEGWAVAYFPLPTMYAHGQAVEFLNGRAWMPATYISHEGENRHTIALPVHTAYNVPGDRIRAAR